MTRTRIRRLGAVTAVVSALGLSTASAQHAGQHNHGGAHAQHQGGAAAAQPDGKATPDTETSSMGGMDHSEMSMQGGSPPPDARDPHEYSDGFRRNEGKYALSPAHRLVMADEHRFGSVLFNRLERTDGKDGNGTAYEAQAWYGSTYNRVVLKAEGEREGGELEHAKTELLWGRAIAPFWDVQMGLRYDSGLGPDRRWLAFGIQGLAPYWFEVDATAYFGSNGRTAISIEAEYELLITQRLILQPRMEVNLYGKGDEALEIGSGVSEGSVGIRLRYEFTRQIAPYVGVEWTNKFGETADIARAADERTRDTRFVAGLRFWF